MPPNQPGHIRPACPQHSGTTCRCYSTISQVSCSLLAAPRPVSCTCHWLQAGQRQREEQEKLLREFQLRRRIRSTVVPTDDIKVRTMLRVLGEPITLFGEKEVCQMQLRLASSAIVAQHMTGGMLSTASVWS